MLRVRNSGQFVLPEATASAFIVRFTNFRNILSFAFVIHKRRGLEECKVQQNTESIFSEKIVVFRPRLSLKKVFRAASSLNVPVPLHFEPDPCTVFSFLYLRGHPP